jgi:ribonuclease PH
MKRVDGRRADEMRPISISPHYLRHAEGSVLIQVGETKVICSATLEEKVPPFLKGSGKGWITAEYGMIPRSSAKRISRESSRGRVSGRTQEIQRLIGRSLRAVVDLKRLGERTIWIDCDVIQADGGTRTAAITGAYVSLHQALKMLVDQGVLNRLPLRQPVAAISVGLVNEHLLLDLCYREDFRAQVDFNVVLTESGELVELQGASEAAPFPRQRVAEILSLASRGVEPLFQAQRSAIRQF